MSSPSGHKPIPWIPVVLFACLIVAGGLAWDRHERAVKAERERMEAVDKLDQIKKAEDLSNLYTKIRLLNAMKGEQDRKSAEEAEQNNLRATSEVALRYGASRWKGGIDIIDSARCDQEGSRIFLYKVNAYDAEPASGTNALIVRSDGSVQESTESHFQWYSMTAEGYVTHFMLDRYGEYYEVEQVSVNGVGSMDAIVRSKTTAKRFQIGIENFSIRSKVQLN